MGDTTDRNNMIFDESSKTFVSYGIELSFKFLSSPQISINKELKGHRLSLIIISWKNI